VKRDLHGEEPLVADDLPGVGELVDRGRPIDPGGSDRRPKLIDRIAACSDDA
jgi:hypothetical protein